MALLSAIIFCFFGILLELVAHESIEESYHEVEDHGCNEPLPDQLDDGSVFLHLSDLSL